jgi:serine O-acetyltransferase
VIGSSVWLTRTVAPHTTVVMETPKLRLRHDTPDDMRPELNYQDIGLQPFGATHPVAERRI